MTISCFLAPRENGPSRPGTPSRRGRIGRRKEVDRSRIQSDLGLFLRNPLPVRRSTHPAHCTEYRSPGSERVCIGHSQERHRPWTRRAQTLEERTVDSIEVTLVCSCFFNFESKEELFGLIGLFAIGPVHCAAPVTCCTRPKASNTRVMLRARVPLASFRLSPVLLPALSRV